jgi:hypothetical protein
VVAPVAEFFVEPAGIKQSDGNGHDRSVVAALKTNQQEHYTQAAPEQPAERAVEKASTPKTQIFTKALITPALHLSPRAGQFCADSNTRRCQRSIN